MSNVKRKATRKRKTKYHVGRLPISQIEFIRNLATDDLNEIQTTFKNEFGKLLKTERIAKYREGLSSLPSNNQEFTVTINHRSGKNYSLREYLHYKMANSYDENITHVMDNVFRQLTDENKS